MDAWYKVTDFTVFASEAKIIRLCHHGDRERLGVEGLLVLVSLAVSCHQETRAFNLWLRSNDLDNRSDEWQGHVMRPAVIFGDERDESPLLAKWLGRKKEDRFDAILNNVSMIARHECGRWLERTVSQVRRDFKESVSHYTRQTLERIRMAVNGLLESEQEGVDANPRLLAFLQEAREYLPEHFAQLQQASFPKDAVGDGSWRECWFYLEACEVCTAFADKVEIELEELIDFARNRTGIQGRLALETT